MTKKKDTAAAKDKPLRYCANSIVTGCVFFISSLTEVLADQASLPVSVNAGSGNPSVINELTSTALHPGIDVGHAQASFSADGHKLTINQATDKAVLDWHSFNIASGNSVQFVQPGSSSVALNNIHQLDASHIFGSLTANGQVYLVNANGFVFGKDASVNANTLLATNLKISDTIFRQGLSKVVASTAGANNLEPLAALSGDGSVYRNTGTGHQEKISILVEKGANITVVKGGRVILAAPEVENDGTINAPDGQVILAGATDKVYLQETSSTELRGLLVEVKTGGDVKNLGKILTERGNTSMLGFAVSQQGVVSASTSVALNGSVRLLAREGAKLSKSSTTQNYDLVPGTTIRATDSGDGLGTQAKVSLESGSTTTVTLDDSAGTAVDGQSQPQSAINVEAGIIQMKNDSKILVPGGKVALTASASPSQALVSTSAANKSRIVLESDSTIDVSGIKNVEQAMARNEIAVELRDNELRDAPLQKTGILHGKTITVDSRKGTPLADITGAIAAIQHSVYERNTVAGTVNLQSEGDVFIQQGARIDISGGSLHYLSGFINATQLVSNGHVYDISQADPNRTYQQILTGHAFQPEYYQGMSAGKINIKPRNLVLDGTINANSINGLYQRSSVALAQGGELSIDTSWSHQYQPDVMFQTLQTFTPDGVVSANQALYLSNALFGNGLSALILTGGGKFTLSKNTNLILPSSGQLTVQAGEIDLQGSITAPAGKLQLKTRVGLDSTRLLSGQLHLTQDSVINSSGSWINDPNDLFTFQKLKVLPLDGGNITLDAQGDLLLDKGSKLSANGGAWLNGKYQPIAGKGGNISLSSAGLIPSHLELGAELSAYALEMGGALSISANDITLSDTIANRNNDPANLNLSTRLLESGGFASYALTSNAGNLEIAPASQIRLQQANWQLNPAATMAASGTNLSALVRQTLLTDYLRKPVNLSLTLAHNATIADGYQADRSISIGKNATITTDPNAELTLNSDANITIDGTLNAPAGQISLTLAPPPSAIDKGYNPDQAIRLGTDAHLNALGTTLFKPDITGIVSGDVKAGGTVSLTANRGYLLMDANSSINVSGSNAWLDIINSRGYSRQNITSNAGVINLTAAEGMVLQGRFMAYAGAGAGGSAGGGSLNLELNAQYRAEPDYIVFTSADRVIHVAADPFSLLNSAQITNGSIAEALNGQAYISVQQITQGGFDRLKLASSVIEPTQYSDTPTQPERGEIRFEGDLSLTLRQSMELDAPVLSHSWNDSAITGLVALKSNIFTLGSSWNSSAQGNLSDPSGAVNNGKNAVLNIAANNIDLRGGSEISGFTKTRLTSSGDIRLIGVNPNSEKDLIGNLNLTGELDLSARQIYPTSLSQFSLTVDAKLSPDSLINILPANLIPSTPLSAAGKLGLTAPNIFNAGNLLAPFGIINLNADKSLTLAASSLTSVSVEDGTVIPFGRTQGELDWIYPLGLYSNIQSGTPQKAISLAGPRIDLQNGAVVNLNGGGNLSAFEFIPGPGGSVDYLDANTIGYKQNYAVLPYLQSGYAPYDPLEFTPSGLTLGDNIYLSANAGLAAGKYVLLPAHYALLPGAFLITPQAGFSDMAAGTTALRIDGAKIIAGFRYSAGSNVADNHWSGFAVEAGSVARTRSEYQETTASQFFKKNAATGAIPALPEDAGNLSLLAGQSLNLAAQISARAALGGLGGMLDISADWLAVIRQSGDSVASGTVALTADDLNKLGVDSILLGGRRTRSSTGTLLNVSAQSVKIASDAHLQAPEILLAATDSITVASGATISAVGNPGKTDNLLDISNVGSNSSDGTLLRVSSAGQASVIRKSSDLVRQTGTLEVASGAQLTSSGSILLDASKDSILNGKISMDKGALTLSSSLITLGNVANANTGLHLSEATLNQLHVDSLSLNSYSTIDIAGAINLQLKDFTIDAAGVHGYGSATQTAKLNANSITLQNTHNAIAGINALGQGLLQLQASNMILGSGNYEMTGFSLINLDAKNQLFNNGHSILTTHSDMRIATPLWTAASGADTTLNMESYQLSTLAVGAATPTSGLGARLSVLANEIDHQGYIELASGVVTLNARQRLTLDSGSSIDTSGQDISLASSHIATPGGTINLAVEHGDLAIQQGATLDLSGSSQGGNLSLSAPLGAISIAGTINGHASQGEVGGSFSMDALNPVYASFSALNLMLQNAGFSGDLSLRQRLGELVIAAEDSVNARNITLTADTGLLSVLGTLDVNGSQAGMIQLAANRGVLVQNGAGLSAVSTDSAKLGGKILLNSAPVNGSSSGVQIADGANLNVSGADTEHGGTIAIVVNRVGDNDAAVAIDNNAIHGASKLTVQAMAHFLDIPLSNAKIQQWRNATQNYMDVATLNDNLQTRLGGFSLQPGLDILSTDSLTLDLAESLTGNAWQQQSSKVWTTQLYDIAGLIGSLQQINGVGVVKNLTAAASSLLTSDGSYYFDSNPQSATFRELFVRIFPNSGAASVKYNPGNITGNLIEHNDWDLALPTTQGQNWHFGDSQSPGLLSFRATGDITIKQNLTDGFALYDASQLGQLLGAGANWIPTLVLQTGSSWSYEIVAGADLQSSAPLARLSPAATGTLTIGSNTSVRTGTGDINLAAAADIRLTDWTSTIYTAGRATDNQRYGNFSNKLVATSFFVDYPFDGGSITLNAGRNIIGASTPQLMSDWLQRTGNWDPGNGITSADRATAWGITFDGLVIQNSANSQIQNLKFGFRENIGALGGGNVNINAGADIQDLSVMLPTSAKPVGKLSNGLIVENLWQQQGGGDLELTAGGNIAGGVFYVDKGQATLRANGAVTGGTQYSSGPIFAMGDARFKVEAGSGIEIGTVLNPFTLTEPKFPDKVDYFTTYTKDSSINLQTLAGDIRFNNDTSLIQQQYKIFDQSTPNGRTILSSASFPLLSLYPGNLGAYALTGGLQIENSMTLFPAAGSSLNLLAAGDISIGNQNNGVTLNQLDVNPANLLSAMVPTTLTGATKYLYTTPFGSDLSTVHATQPIHLTDTIQNKIISGYGSIIGIGNALVSTAKATEIWTSQDMVNLGLMIQNINLGDITGISAGRDIIYPLQRDSITGRVLGSAGGIQLAGPGMLNVWAGRNIDLGSSEGITTVGSLLNSALPGLGADIMVLAGYQPGINSSPLDYFLHHYVLNGTYLNRLATLNQQVTTSGRLQIALGVLFDEIRTAAKVAATSQGPAQQLAYQRGYDAIARLFPQSTGGDIKLFFSRIQTLEAGNINLLAPSGMINAGLASAFTSQKSQAELGIVVQRQGDINVLVQGNLQINQSRVFTLDSGDITAWSSEGNIDAGRGAKSATATQQPIISMDANGNLKVEFPATVSGSGIRAQSGYNSTHIGNVILAAPRGIVDAGEAGIGGRDITIAAKAVIGASNIQALGNTFGVPQTAVALSAPANLSNSAVATTKTASNPTLEDEEESAIKRKNKAAQVTIFDTQVIGFGDWTVADIQANRNVTMPPQIATVGNK